MAIRPGMNKLTAPPPQMEEEEPMAMSAPPAGANTMPPGGMEPPAGREAGDSSLEGRVFQKMLEVGMDPNDPQLQSMDPKEVLQMAVEQIWASFPTDENAELIEQISGQYGLAPPWGKGGMPPGGPGGQVPGGMPNALTR